jgi:sugar phosphate isomerase/epimerase
MRLGGPSFYQGSNPDEWVAALQQLGYSAAYLEGGGNAPEFAHAAQQAGIVIAETGAWSNPLAADPVQRKAAMDKCIRQLQLADETGARCCVNIAGSRGDRWDGPDVRNLLPETFEMIVESVRQIIDTAKPTRTFYALETMPWIAPDSPDCYLAMIDAIDRRNFAVHLDVVNMINCPTRAYDTAGFIRECFAKLAPYIKSIHAKDVCFSSDRHLTLHLDECRPGAGLIDFATLLREAAKLHPATPVMLEHLPSEQEYKAAAAFLGSAALGAGVQFQ